MGLVRVVIAHLRRSSMDVEDVGGRRVWMGGLCLPAGQVAQPSQGASMHN